MSAFLHTLNEAHQEDTEGALCERSCLEAYNSSCTTMNLAFTSMESYVSALPQVLRASAHHSRGILQVLSFSPVHRGHGQSLEWKNETHGPSEVHAQLPHCILSRGQFLYRTTQMCLSRKRAIWFICVCSSFKVNDALCTNVQSLRRKTKPLRWNRCKRGSIVFHFVWSPLETLLVHISLRKSPKSRKAKEILCDSVIDS